MLVVTLINILISNALTIKKDKSILYSRIVMITLVLSALVTLNNLYILSLDKGVALYGGLFHTTPYTQTFSIFILIISAVILNLTSFYPRKLYTTEWTLLSLLSFSKLTSKVNTYLSANMQSIVSNKNSEQFKIIEYPLIVLFVIIGALFLMSGSNLISLFLSIELQSYGLYILSTLYRDSEKATGAGLTYFLLGGLSSCFILLGSSLLYINSGTTSLEAIYLINSISEISFSSLPVLSDNINIDYSSSLYKPYYMHLSLIILAVGFLFKVSAAPFHFWSPDVYDAIPTIVTTFVAIIAKISIFIFFLELVYYTCGGDYKSFAVFSWSNCLLISSLASLIIGSILGLVQKRIKRLYAYSTISHVGFILLGLSVNSVESVQAYIFYIIVYTISNLNAFLILLAIGYSLFIYVNNNEDYTNIQTVGLSNTSLEPLKRDTLDKNNSPIQLISELKGYFYINPYLAVSLAITLFSFVGVPPLFGFFAKQMILSAALDSGYFFITLVAILTSVIGAVYYLGLIKQIFFFSSDYKLNPSINAYNSTLVNNIVLSSGLTLSISMITLTLIAFIFTPNEWLNVANILTILLFNS